MSREFGSYEPGYFSEQIDCAADDCLGGRDEITRLWGAFLKEFQPIAYAIASSEANDSSVSFPISESIERMRKLHERLRNIEKYLEPFDRVSKDAVAEYIRKLSEEKHG